MKKILSVRFPRTVEPAGRDEEFPTLRKFPRKAKLHGREEELPTLQKFLKKIIPQARPLADKPAD
jgi:hypothetical protein